MKTWKKTIPKVGIHRCIRNNSTVQQYSQFTYSIHVNVHRKVHKSIWHCRLSTHVFTVHCFVNPCMCNVWISQPDIQYLADLDMPKFLVNLSYKVHSGCQSSWLE